MRTLVLFLAWSHFASAEYTSNLDRVQKQIDALSCEAALGRPNDITARPVEALEISSRLMAGVPADAEPEEIGPAFLRSFTRVMAERPLVDPPVIDGEYPHLRALERLDRRVNEMIGGMRNRRQAASVAFAVAAVYTDVANDIVERQEYARRRVHEIAERFAAPSGEAALTSLLETLATTFGETFSNFTKEIIPPKVKARLSERSIRYFLARELIVIKDLLDEPDLKRPLHLTFPPQPRTGPNIRLHTLAARLRNDFRLIALREPTLHGPELLVLRQAVDALGAQLNAITPVNTFYDFTMPTIELIMTDAVASRRLRQLLMNRLPPADLLPPLEESSARRPLVWRGGTPRPVGRTDARAPRVVGLKWYVTHVRPELVRLKSAIDESNGEIKPWRLELTPEQATVADREIRAGAFDRAGYLAWAEAAEACFRSFAPRPVPVTAPVITAAFRMPTPTAVFKPTSVASPPAKPGSGVKTARVVLSNVVALGLSFILGR